MNILLLNKDVYWGGGAARSTYRLWQGYQELGHEVKVLTRMDKPIPEEWAENVFHLEAGVSEELGKLLFEEGWMDLFVPAAENFHKHPLVEWADVVHIQNLHGNYFPYRVLPKLCEAKPVVWTMRDFWTLTGGCPYPMTNKCGKFKSPEGCHDCPDLGNYPLSDKDTTHFQWNEKRKVFGTPCDYMPVFVSYSARNFALNSGMCYRREPLVVHNGVEVERFRPVPKSEARKLLGIHDIPTVIVQGSHYKNPHDAIAALKMLAEQPQVLLFGPHMDMDVFKGYKGGIVNLNEIDHVTLTTAFAAAEVFLFPTKAETFGNVVAESLSAGTICVGYNNTSLPEILQPFGSVTELGDVAGLASLTQGFLDDPVDPKDLHRHVVEKFNLKDTVRKYETILMEVVNRRNP